jgi:hypothetical protein
MSTSPMVVSCAGVSTTRTTIGWAAGWDVVMVSLDVFDPAR